MIDTNTKIDTPDWYIRYDWHTWLIHTLLLTHLIDTYTVYQSYCMYQSGVSIIVYVSIRCINHNGRINQMYQSDVSIMIHLIDTYTRTDTPDWYIHYDWYTRLLHTLWLTHLIDIYTVIDTADWYIHYDWYTWLIQSIRSINLSVCINHSVYIN
jgi:hypothetical protein